MRLKGHEKFSLREGWITKGLKGLDNPRVFQGDNAPDRLGVGSNMVKSIRYWMLAFQLTEENAKEGTLLSKIGEIIKKNDLYLEDPFTLWLLHSLIAKNEDKATTWYMFFNHCQAEEFHKEELFLLLKKEMLSAYGENSFKDNSLRDDIDVLLNMYSKEKVLDDPEDKNQCPLTTLGLLKKEKDVYYKTSPDFRKFPDDIILYELAEKLAEEKSVSIEAMSDLSQKLYQISRIHLNNILDRLSNLSYIEVNRTAGLDMIYANEIGNVFDVITNHYEGIGE